MGYAETVKSINWKTVFFLAIAVIPYVDSETMGVVPVLRDLVPFVEPVYTLQLSWTERLRLAVLLVIPYVDGEIIELLTGMDVNEVIADR